MLPNEKISEIHRLTIDHDYLFHCHDYLYNETEWMEATGRFLEDLWHGGRHYCGIILLVEISAQKKREFLIQNL